MPNCVFLQNFQTRTLLKVPNKNQKNIQKLKMKFNALLFLITLILLQQKNSIQYLNGLTSYYPGYLNPLNLQRIYNCTQNNANNAQKNLTQQKFEKLGQDYKPVHVRKYVRYEPKETNASTINKENQQSLENLPTNLYQFLRTMMPSHVLANHNLTHLKATLEKYNDNADEKVSFNTLIQLQLKEPNVFNLLTAPKNIVVTNLKNVMKYANRTMPNQLCTANTACTANVMPTKDMGVANNTNSQNAAQNILDVATVIETTTVVKEHFGTNVSSENPITETENPNNFIATSTISAVEQSVINSDAQHGLQPEIGQLQQNDRPRFETNYQQNDNDAPNINLTQLPSAESNQIDEIKTNDTPVSEADNITATGVGDPVSNSEVDVPNIRGIAQFEQNIAPNNTLVEMPEKLNFTSQNVKGESSIFYSTEPPPEISSIKTVEYSEYTTTIVPQIDIRIGNEPNNIVENVDNYVTVSVPEIPGATTGYTILIDETSETSEPAELYTIESNNIEDGWQTTTNYATYATSTEAMENNIQVTTDIPDTIDLQQTTAANELENIMPPPKEEAFIDLGESITTNKKDFPSAPPIYETDIMPDLA